MFWILATTAFLMVFGGILLVLPSKHERRVGQMRIDARKSGLQTQGIVVTDVNASAVERVTAGGKIRTPKIRCIAWEKRYSDDYDNIPLWTLYESSKGSAPIQGFIVEPRLNETGLEHQREYWGRVGRAIDHLPAKLIAIKSSRNSVAWIGQELMDSTPEEFIDRMSVGLKELSEANTALAKRLRSE